ncbi:zinc-binding dehydrogenase [Burkholderia contaminans]|nr:zinc-binding dehydrogenase [Burkholderia contaminans]
MATARNSLDFVFDTTPSVHDLNPLLRVLKRDGTVIMLGSLAPESPMVHSALLVAGRKSIAGSMIGGIEETEAMLEFCVANDMTADIRLINIDQINEAFDRMSQGNIFYRFVIDMSSLKTAHE